MTILEGIGYLAMASVLISYGYMKATGKFEQFDWVNFLASIPLVILAFSTGAVPNALLSMAFGVIGVVGIGNAYRKRNRISKRPGEISKEVLRSRARGEGRKCSCSIQW